MRKILHLEKVVSKQYETHYIRDNVYYINSVIIVLKIICAVEVFYDYGWAN